MKTRRRMTRHGAQAKPDRAAAEVQPAHAVVEEPAAQLAQRCR